MLDNLSKVDWIFRFTAEKCLLIGRFLLPRHFRVEWNTH